MTFDLFKAFILGVVEGLTEFLPVSSTGHLLLVQRFFGFDDEDFGKTFAVLIQFGAILALLSIYFPRIWQIALGMFKDPAARRFVIGVAGVVIDRRRNLASVLGGDLSIHATVDRLCFALSARLCDAVLYRRRRRLSRPARGVEGSYVRLDVTENGERATENGERFFRSPFSVLRSPFSVLRCPSPTVSTTSSTLRPNSSHR